MITSLRLVDFKNFADETLHLGPFTLIVGANASGKSNIRDAFRLLHGIGLGYTLAEIFGGKYGAEWQPIRGAPNEIVRFGRSDFSLEFEIKSFRFPLYEVDRLRYSIRIHRDGQSGGRFRVAAESLTADPRTSDSLVSGTLYTTSPSLHGDKHQHPRDSKLLIDLPDIGESVEVSADQPVFNQLPRRLLGPLEEVGRSLIDGTELTDNRWNNTKASWGWLEFILKFAKLRFLEISPERLREPSLPGAIKLGDSGDNLPTVLEAICADPKRKDVLLSWIHELTPMDVSDLEFPVDLNGRVNLQIREADGRRISAYSASDGTLRFLGMLAALLNEDADGLYFIEEIDNGIHPARLHLLLDLIERQTAKGKIQVVATTHSPDVLNLINDTTFENTSVVYRDEDSADAVIRRVAELPNARELRKSQGLGRLHTAGWMEDILAFSQVDDEDGERGV